MSNQNPSNPQTNDTAPLPPPSGNPEKAERYLTQLIELINTDKLLVSHTDLSKFDPTSLQNHYRLDLKDYEVEVSHSKQPDSGQDFYVLLFNNLKLINERCTEKVILAYIHISADQFAKFKTVAEDQLERKRKEAEEKRFEEVMTPLNQVLDGLSSSQPVEEERTNPLTENASGQDGQYTPVDSPAASFDSTQPPFVLSS